jgi:2-iminobutanoate/2-iminopropanoate deaminase
MSEKKVVHPPGMAKPAGVFSSAIVVKQPSRLMFLSGMTARDETGNVVCVGDIRGQTKLVCEKLRVLVEAEGGSLKDIVSVTVFVLDVKHFTEIHEVRRQYFPSEPPASTMVEVSRLVDDRMLIEINAIAALP